ncbi:MAG: FAD-binding oxidoreductase, partial [Candidatus Marinimicrobia bacterium]|nr:FAD-binding oxidoreductase [Candidatus Neomarinimicrobiota bacterium]
METLSGILPDSCIHDDLITRLAYSRDASMYRLIPKSVTRPKNETDIRALLNYGNRTKTPITFRTAGTSLSGQSITTGIIAEVLYDWQKFKVLENGNAIWCQPGVNGAVVNKILNPYRRRIGPDPASINVARMGGIISNNSSGMVCGTQFNAYHTLKELSFILANGNFYDTSQSGEREKFRLNEPELAIGLINLKKEIESNSKWSEKIRQKYRLKNTIGYSINSFLDYDHPLDIFKHLLVGAEGTLAFLSNVTLNTIPDPEHKGTGLVLFKTPEEAGESVSFFKDLGASAIEFMDDESLRTAKHFENPPYDPNLVANDVTGLLIEYQKDSVEEINRLMSESKSFTEKDSSVISMSLVTDQKDRETIWQIRKGLYPTLGSLRKTGTSIITEDIAVDTKNLAPAIRGLKNIFNKREFHDGVIFGHAKDGNLHFITSVDLDNVRGVKNYEGMMDDLSEMTLGEFNGSLKAEHGTGRNMAAFVEAEWGGPLYEIMWRIKSLADPCHILNPDVL